MFTLTPTTPAYVGVSFSAGRKAAWVMVFAALLAATAAPFSTMGALLLLPAALLAWHRTRPSREALNWLMLAWFVWLPASLTWSMAPGLSLPQAAVLLCLPLGWLVGTYLKASGNLEGLLEKALPALLLALILWGLLQGPDALTGKPQGPLNDPNTYVTVVNLLALPVLAHYLAADLSARSAWWRTAHLSMVGGVAFTLFLVASRGATLALLLVLPFVTWLARLRPAFLHKMFLLAVVVAVAYMAALVVSDGTSNVVLRLEHTVERGDPSRLMVMRSAGDMILEHPWLGTGLGTFRLRYPIHRHSEEVGTAGGWVHNDYLQLWLEAGLPMLILLAGLVAWLARVGWQTLRQGDAAALERMGYLAGIGAVLLHALVNFVFYFAVIGLLVGMYLAQAGHAAQPEPSQTARQGRTRAATLAGGGYVLILGLLLIGQVAVEGLLEQAHVTQRLLSRLGMAYPRYDAAYWVSVAAPYHPMPYQVMGLELADTYAMTGHSVPMMRDEALERMASARRRAPCYLPYANDALALILAEASDAAMRARGRAIVEQNLLCNARHGLSHYHAGVLARHHSESEALRWWCAGLATSPTLVNQLLLGAAILSHTTPQHAEELMQLTAEIADAVRVLEATPRMRPDTVFWNGVQYKLIRITGQTNLGAMTATACKTRGVSAFSGS